MRHCFLKRWAFRVTHMKEIDYRISPGKVTHVYSAEETADIDKAWVNLYCKDKQGANIKDYRWHIFSFERYPSLSGDEALAQYKKQKACEYIVLSNDGEPAIETDTLPYESDLRDFLVFPRNMAWTMAFTHEDGWLGPYFAKHRDYEKLSLENERLLKQKTKKQIEIAKAKQKGWM